MLHKHYKILLIMMLSISASLIGMYLEDEEREHLLETGLKEDVTMANRAAFAGSCKTLEQLFNENPDYIFQHPAECFSPSSYSALFSQASPQLVGTPLLFAVLSARQPEQKINFLKAHGQLLESSDPNPKTNPFWVAVERHEHEKTSMSRSILITMLRNYPEALLFSNQDGEPFTDWVQRLDDKQLLKHIMPLLQKTSSRQTSYEKIGRKLFWDAVDTYDKSPSSLNRSSIIAFLKKHPENNILLSRNEKGETILIHAARNLDAALIADLLWETSYNAQLIEAPLESPANTPAERMQETPDAKRFVEPAPRLQRALDIVRFSIYEPSPYFIIRLFGEESFNAQKDACLSLLEKAHAKIEERTQVYLKSRQDEAPVKGLYPETKKEQ